MATVIQAEQLSKAYQLGDFGTGTISRDLERFWARARGKEDPFLKLGEQNDRTVSGGSDLVWSLRELDFEIRQGDAVGVIGRNGAGKSTLLKILSRVTAPTAGSVRIKGRIASLLEVGTGFHPELTGRENIFLNGAILGMRRAEIKRKFEEIVSFAGVARYIDTPVKRYSSGMYVRLAFAVAAHLESEILIVDEVLAVGDAEFQKKCIGKMDEVSRGEGRTVLFVSHNMSTIQGLCNQGMLLHQGRLQEFGPAQAVIASYMRDNVELGPVRAWNDAAEIPGDEVVRLRAVRAMDRSGQTGAVFDTAEPLGIEIDYEVLTPGHVLWHGLNFYTPDGLNLFDAHSVNSRWYREPHPAGRFRITAWLPAHLLNEGRLLVNVAIFNHNQHVVHLHEKNVIAFEMADLLQPGMISARGDQVGRFPGLVRPLLQWE